MQVVVDGPWSNGSPPFGYCCACDSFLVICIQVSGCFLSIAMYLFRMQLQKLWANNLC